MKNKLANYFELLLYGPIFSLGEAVNVVHPSDPHSPLLTISKPAKYTVIQNGTRVTFPDERYS